MAYVQPPVRVNGDVITATIWEQDIGENSRSTYREAIRAASDTTNPYFDVWQRNTTFSPAAATNTYTADRWRVNIGTGGVATISRQANTPGAPLGAGEEETPFCLRWAQSSGGTGTLALSQPHESARTRAGEVVTVVFIAKVSSGTLSVTPKLVQKFGTGGSPSADVTLSGSAKTVTTAYQKFTATLTLGSVSGKTFGSNGDDSLDLRLELPASTTFTLDVALCAIIPGTATSMVVGRRRIHDELQRCQRFYQRLTANAVIAALDVTNGVQYWRGLPFPVEMFKTPAVVFTNTSSGFSSVSVDAVDSTSMRVTGTASATNTGRLLNGSATLDAELNP